MSKKDKQKQTGAETISLIAKQSSLTQDQVRECFLTFREMIDVIIKSNYSSDLEFSLPYIGTFSFTKKKGKKKGSTYIVPQTDGTVINKTLEEDRPDYNFIRFDIRPEIQKLTREISEDRFMKKLNSIYKDKK